MASSESQVVSASAMPLPHQRVPANQLVSGPQTVATVELGALQELHYGVWEISPGVSTDRETDEVFVVLAGRARVTFPEDGYSIEIQAGDLVRLAEGQHSVWNVTETLRKVYFSA